MQKLNVSEKNTYVLFFQYLKNMYCNTFFLLLSNIF